VRIGGLEREPVDLAGSPEVGLQVARTKTAATNAIHDRVELVRSFGTRLRAIRR
jgi:hypothetical protein